TTGQTAFYRLSIDPTPAGTTASFDQKTPLASLDVTILPKTTISRTVFVTSSTANPTVTVTVAEIVAVGGALKTNGLQSTALINPDITDPDITNPDITNPDITNVAVTNPDITNPDITNPDITNPDITNPDITNPDITNLADNGGTIKDFTYKVTNKGNTSSSYN